jgi:hypothetical protein
MCCWRPGSAHLALMLCYRDLYIPGFWLYGNYHYFKVTQPVFLLFAVLLAVRLADRATRWRAAAAATVAIVLLFGWRASLAPMPGQLAAATSGGVAIPSLGSLDDAVIVQGTGTWGAFYYRANVLTIDGVQFSSPYDFMFYPRSTDFLLVPLRPLPPHPGC